MTEKKQPEALELASVAESADLAGYPTAKKANAYCLCLLEDCAHMIRRLHAENETLQQGYAAARLEIESLRARSVVPAAALAQLRHIYTNLKNGGVRDTAQAKRIADSLLGPVIESMERAQAAPAAVAGCTRSHPHENMDSACQAKAAIAEMQNMAARGAEATTSDLERFVAMLAAAPTTQPAPQQETQSALFDKQGFRAWVLHNLPDDTIIGSSAYWADHLSAWAQRFVKKAPQQEAQEPVAWYVTGCGRLLDEYDAEAEARRIGGTAKAMPLYTVPQPAPASQGDALDAARLDWLDEDDGNHVSKVGKTWYTRPAYGRPYRKHKNLRAAIDAARAAQEGK